MIVRIVLFTFGLLCILASLYSDHEEHNKKQQTKDNRKDTVYIEVRHVK